MVRAREKQRRFPVMQISTTGPRTRSAMFLQKAQKQEKTFHTTVNLMVITERLQRDGFALESESDSGHHEITMRWYFTSFGI